MKKILISLLSLSLTVPVATNIVACEPVEQFPSKSATTTDAVINELFTYNNINLLYFDYLSYINGFFEHVNFDGSLSINKTSSPILSSNEGWDENKTNYYQALSQIFLPRVADGGMDFTGMTYIIENIFIDDFVFSITPSLNVSVTTTMAVTVLKGWKTVGKLLLSASNATPLNNWDTNQFINVWIKSLGDALITSVTDDKTGSDDYFSVRTNLSATNLVEQIVRRSTQLKGFLITTDNFIIDEKTNSFQLNNYTYKIED